MSVYLVKPLEKKSIVYHVEMYRKNADGSISWFNIDETYRWGQGFIESDETIYLDAKVIVCSPNLGWGCEFDDSISIDWEFSDDISEMEQQELKELYYEGGAGWLFDGEHDWQEEHSSVYIYGPFQVSLCENNGRIIEENVKLTTTPTVPDQKPWPFPTGE